jgi:small conductance mechanosensitive channel
MDGTTVERLKRVGVVLADNGAEMIQALLILVVGLILIHWLMRRLKIFLDKALTNRSKAATIISSLYVFLITVILAAVLVQLGIDGRNVIRVVIIISLIAIALIVLLRPYVPTLPFKVGNTVKVGDLLGKIEATTLVHTRIRTFDGKTVFIPNEKILRDFVINYNVTPTRRIKIDIPIRHIKDLLRTKQLLEKIMVADPRVLQKPARPVVYTINLVEGCVMLGVRCWVDNAKFWMAKCDLLEKMLLTLDREGVALAFRRKAIRVFHETPLTLSGLTETTEGSGPQTETASAPGLQPPLMTAVPTEDMET